MQKKFREGTTPQVFVGASEAVSRNDKSQSTMPKGFQAALRLGVLQTKPLPPSHVSLEGFVLAFLYNFPDDCHRRNNYSRSSTLSAESSFRAQKAFEKPSEGELLGAYGSPTNSSRFGPTPQHTSIQTGGV